MEKRNPEAIRAGTFALPKLRLLVPPLRYASVGMTKVEGGDFYSVCRIGWTKKPQVPPLRFASVGMTILFKLEDFA